MQLWPCYVSEALCVGLSSTATCSWQSGTEADRQLAPSIRPSAAVGESLSSVATSWRGGSPVGTSWAGLDLWEELRELVGLSCTAVVSCSVCSLVSISKAAPPMRISPQLSAPPPPALPRDAWAGGRRLHTQHAAKNDSATSSSKGPMMMGGFLVGTNLPNAKAPTSVILMPASMMQRPHAQHRAGEGRPWGRSFRFLEPFLGTEVLAVLSGWTMVVAIFSRACNSAGCQKH